jgi:mitogen-activated protein kinase 15
VNNNSKLKDDEHTKVEEHIIRRFELQEFKGKGAYGVVWKAVDKKTKEVVALKKIFDAFHNATDS